MASVTLLRRADGSAYQKTVDEANDSVALGTIHRTSAGAGSLWADNLVTTITIGGGSSQSTITIGKDGQKTEFLGSLAGANDGTGLLVGHAPTGASTGSALQVVSLTTTERNNLVVGSGMIIYNSTTGVLEGHNGSGWVDLMAGAGGASSLASTLAVGNTTGANDIVVSTGQRIVGAAELTLVSTTTGAVTLDSGTTGAINIGVDGVNAKTITVGNSTGATGIVVDAGTGGVSFGSTGEIVIDSSTAVASAVEINASNVAGGIDLNAGVTSGTITLDAGGAISLNSSAGAVSLAGAAASSFTTTGAGVDITIDATGGRVVIDGGEAVQDAVRIVGAGIDIDASGAGGNLAMNAGGAINLTSANSSLTLAASTTASFTASSLIATFVDSVAITASASTLALSSGTGTTIESGTTIGIGTGVQDGAISIGTGASTGRSITVGNATGATTLTLRAGTGAFVLTQAGGDAITVGQVGAAGTGSTLGVPTFTTTERNANLVATNGMVIYNSTTATLEGYVNGSWTDLAGGGASPLSDVLVAGNTTGANDIVVSTGQRIVGAAELTLVSTTTGTASLDSGTTGAVNVGTGAASKQVTLGSTTGTSGLTLRTGTNPLSVVAGGVFDVDVTGAITFDSSAAGISLDGITSSNFTVTGAAQSLTLAALGGGAQSVTLSSAGTNTNAIRLNATGGGIDIDAVLGSSFSITANSPASQELRIEATNAGAGNATITADCDDTFTIASTNASVLIDANTALELNASGGPISIGNDAVNGAINVGTGTTAGRSIAIGNPTGGTSVSIDAGGGDIALTSAASGITLDATGVISINSSGGAIDVGNNANAQAINVGTGAAARTITLGNATGATSLVLNAGTGNIDIGTGAQARSVNVATGAAAQTVAVGSTTGASSLTLQGGTGTVAITQAGGDAITVGQTGGTGTGSTLGAPSFTTAQLGTNLTATNGMVAYDTTEAELVGRVNGAWEPLGLAENAEAYAAGPFTTTNTAATLVTGMTLTEGTDFDGAGNYRITFSGSATFVSTNESQFMEIYVGGTLVTNSARIATSGGGPTSGVRVGFCCDVITTVTAGQAVEGRLRSVGGASMGVDNTSLIVQRVR